MPTLGELIEQVRGATRDRPARDTIVAALDLDDTTVQFASGAMVSPTSFVDFNDASFEAALIVEKASTDTATVARAARGTTAATHAAGAPVWVSPRHYLAEYRDAINAALASIGAVYKRRRWTTATFGTSRVLEVPATATGVFALSELPDATISPRPVAAVFEPALPAAISSTGKGIRLTSYNPGSGTAHIGYETWWTELTTWDSTLDAEYPAQHEDVIVMGAMAYLLDRVAFDSVAYMSSSVRTDPRSNPASSVQAGNRLALSRFLARRFELAPEQPPQMGWLKGG